jgi:leucyl-tRNA synthetase
VIRLLAPLAPYLAEELWAATAGQYSVHTQPWPVPAPVVDPTPAAAVTLVVQVDGRVRARLTVPAGLTADEARRQAEAAPDVARHVAGRGVDRIVPIPHRSLNLMTFRRSDVVHYGKG